MNYKNIGFNYNPDECHIDRLLEYLDDEECMEKYGSNKAFQELIEIYNRRVDLNDIEGCPLMANVSRKAKMPFWKMSLIIIGVVYFLYLAVQLFINGVIAS